MFPRGQPEPGGEALSLSLQTRPGTCPSCPWWSRGAGGRPSCSARWTATRPPTSRCCGVSRPSPPRGAPPTPASPSRPSPTPCGCGWRRWARGTRGSTSARPTTASAPRPPPCSSRRAVSAVLPGAGRGASPCASCHAGCTALSSSSGVRVTVEPSPEVPEGATATMNCSAVPWVGDEANYTWYKNSRWLREGPASALILGPVSSTDAGFYHCRASGVRGSAASAPLSLSVLCECPPAPRGQGRLPHVSRLHGPAAGDVALPPPLLPPLPAPLLSL